MRVLVVDDSAVVRGLLVKALESDPAIEIAGTAMHGEAALRHLRSGAVDVVVLDVEMPVMDGLTALRHIQKDYPRVRVVVASASTHDGAKTTVEALALGAVDCIAKPVAESVHESIQQLAEKLVPLVRALGPAEPEHPRAHAPEPGERSGGAEGAPRRSFYARKEAARVVPDVVVIGTSTGGPNALSQLVKELPRDFQQPILIVQHMPPLFTPMLAKHLERDGGRPCTEASHGQLIETGRTYLAPGDYHLSIGRENKRLVCQLDQNPPEHFCRPSVNPLFRSAAEYFGPRALAVMLTGMGDDGIEGTREIVARQGQVIAQDEGSAVVWGMPGAVVREGLADSVVPLEQVASVITQWCSREVHAR